MLEDKTNLIGIVVNGEPCQVAAGGTVFDLLRHLDIDPDRVAVEMNRRIVRQPEWRTTPVEEGAAFEIVQFVGGG